MNIRVFIFYQKSVPVGIFDAFEKANNQSQVLMVEFPTIKVFIVNLYVVPRAKYDLNETLKMFETMFLRNEISC